MRWIAAAVSLVLFAALAFASPLGGAVTALRGACDTRVAAIAANNAEKAQLGKASVALGGYSGSDLYADGSALAAAGRALKASRTKDAGVVGRSADVVSCLADAVRTELTAVNSSIVSISDSTIRAACLRLILAGQGLADQASATSATSPGQALILLSRSLGKLSAAAARGKGAATFGGVPSTILPYQRGTYGMVQFLNRSGAQIEVKSVLFDVVATFSNGTSKRYSRTQVQVAFALHEFPPAIFVQDGTYFDTRGESFRKYLQQEAKKHGLTLSRYQGVVVVEIVGLAPFVVASINN